MIAWIAGGPSDIDNLATVCEYHHRLLDHGQWVIRMRDGVPEWLPPPWLDPDQKPLRNTAHHLPEIEFRQGPGGVRIAWHRPDHRGGGPPSGADPP